MSTALDRIIEQVKGLSAEERRRLLEVLSEDARSAEQTERERLAATIRGKYKDVLTSSEEFARRKADELDLEERR
jgi:hypothetical protein